MIRVLRQLNINDYFGLKTYAHDLFEKSPFSKLTVILHTILTLRCLLPGILKSMEININGLTYINLILCADMIHFFCDNGNSAQNHHATSHEIQEIIYRNHQMLKSCNGESRCNPVNVFSQDEKYSIRHRASFSPKD